MARRSKRVPDAIDVESFSAAHRHLLQNFVSPIQTTYSLAKTEFRDLLYDKLGCSLGEAEKLVDALEEMNKIEFQGTQKGSRYGFRIVHCDSEDGVSQGPVA